MQVIANDEYPNKSGEEIAEYVTVEELYARADVIALHCPLFQMCIRDRCVYREGGRKFCEEHERRAVFPCTETSDGMA